MSGVKVSVTLVTYNHERFIAQALDGILMQETDFDFDIIVGDDCSTDGTRAIIDAYKARHPGKIITVYPERNMGDAGRPMFVETLKHCTGDYIAMQDGDDYWTAPDKLQVQADYLDAHPQCSLCYHDATLVAEGTSVPTWRFMPPDHPEFTSGEDLIWSCFIPACSAMVRREWVADLPPWFYDGPWADLPFYIIVAQYGLLGFINRKLGAYRIHPNSVWSSLDPVDQITSAIAVLDSLPPGLRHRYRKAISETRSYHHVELARVLLKRRQAAAAFRHMRTAILLDPRLRRSGYRRIFGKVSGWIGAAKA